ncbi:DsbA family oxidoreductase [Alicyclobacillus shizuokensis]|uniref:DsbA family oxidoreductase n=1 Tax=Alicyclobacillus shizuokensis TaxID=392014 RepID=UPI0008306924|nr:DsbA family oxidoreductase [Alicyclobacillus shizuokensis]
MKIEVWSDFVCPFCYIGKRHLEQALCSTGLADKAEVVFKSFELDPASPVNPGTSVHERLAAKYGMSLEEARAANAKMAERAAAVGLTYHFDTMIPTNTFDAHRLAQFAAQKGAGETVVERLFKAYFTDSLHIGDRLVLVQIASEAGLDAEETRSMLEEGGCSERVRADEAEAQQLGIHGVPFFVVNRRYAISGAQPIALFVDTLQKAWEEEQKNKPRLVLVGDDSQDADSPACTDGSCSV